MFHLIRRAIQSTIRRVFRFLLRSIGVFEDDPWSREDLERGMAGNSWFPPADYFRVYRHRPSNVHPTSLDDVCAWLLACQYDDDAYAQAPNWWPVPGDFETTRTGNCFDHSLWAWRKLGELGIPCSLVFCQSRALDGVFSMGAKHCWVEFSRNEVPYHFEATAKTLEHMILPLVEARVCYRPWFAVDFELRRYRYHGFILAFLD